MILKDPKSFLGLTSQAQQINSILLKCLMRLGASQENNLFHTCFSHKPGVKVNVNLQ